MTNTTFEFGKNWDAFLKRSLSDERIAEAEKSLREFTGGLDFRGKSFIDVGCGSGLFSFAAHRLGAAPMLSFDVDPHSVKCCEFMRQKAGNPDHWRVTGGSVLDADFVGALGRWDFVYSWGVLHHTGNMWKAIDNASRLVADGGHFYLAIYNKAEAFGIYPDGRFGPSRFWTPEKKLYNILPRPLKAAFDYLVMASAVAAYILTLKNPIRVIRGQRERRGMSWRTDIRDWLGGYPYEYASVSEIFDFMKERGFAMENVKCASGLGNNEFLFRKTGV